MRSGQPYPRLIAAVLCAAAAAATAWSCGGSTSVSSVIGPGGGRCQTTVQGQPTSVPHTGGQIAVSVTASRDCTWEASTDAAWMQLSSTSGQGDGTFNATAAANDVPAPRTGAVIVNDQRLTVTQEARPCSFDVRPPDRISSAGGRGNIRVETASGCPWTASSSAPWLRVLTASGQGPGEIAIEADPNTGPPRDATVSVGGRAVTVLQNGAGDTPAPPPDCTATVAPASIDAPAGGGQFPIALNIAGPCDWTASTTETWAQIGMTSGRGPTTIQVTVAAHTGIGSRTATITIADRPVTVTQDGITCSYAIDDAAKDFPASGGEGRVNVTTSPGCTWRVSGAPSWINVNGGQRSGGGQVVYTVQENGSTSARSATLTIAGRPHRVNQQAAAPACTYRVEPTSASFGAGSGTGSFNIVTDAGCSWSTSSDQGWAAVTSPANGSGAAQVSYRVDANGTTSERTARITVNGQAHTITQAGATPTCSYRVEPASATFGAGGGPGSFNIVTEGGCSWTVSSDQGWAAVTTAASGSGPAQVSYRVDANSATSERTARITVNGQSHTVTQAAAAPVCTYRVEPTSASVGADGGTGSFSVVTEGGCAWNAASDQGWAAVTSAASGSGPGQVSYRIDANSAASERTARITVNGQSHTVTQAAAAPVCAYSLAPPEHTVGAQGGIRSVTVTTAAGCSWTPAANASWVIVNDAVVRTGPGTFGYAVQPNPGTSRRSAAVTAGDRTHTVTQEPAGDDLHAFLTVRLPHAFPGGPYCSSCTAPHSLSRY